MKTTRPTTTTTLFCFLFLLFVLVEVAVTQNTTVAAGSIPVNVGVVLDYLDTWVGKLGLSCINMALSDFYSNHGHYKTKVILNTRDSKVDVVGAAAAALDLIKNVQVQAIIGTEYSMQANFVIDLGDKSQVPIISFSATSPFLTSIRNPYFFRATQNDSSQVKAISAIVQAYGWREVVPIYEDDEFGEGIVSYLADSLEEIGARIPYRSIISPDAKDVEIEEELYKLMTMQTRVFVVHMDPVLGLRIFDKAKEIGMMSEGYVWIITDGMTNLWSLMSSSDMDSMQGVLGVRTYVPKSTELENFQVKWRKKFLHDNPNVTHPGLDIFGLWAYDATFALAMAVEKVGAANNFSFRFNTFNVSGATARTDLDTLGVSENGPKFLQVLSSTKVKGLSGDFGFLDGQLDSSVFEIINVNGNAGRVIGFWTSDYGLVKKLDFTNLTRYSTSKDNLGTIIWPGDPSYAPKGWEIPTNGKKLKIGVPVKDGFSEFVDVQHDPSTNSTTVTGYSIDVFDAVMDAMPYAVTYDFIPYENATGEMAGTYNDLVYQVYLGNYDAVVGDVSIVANRSKYVDFTLPYTESGVVMVVPIKDDSNKNAWVFLKPLTWDLWLTSGCFFVFIGFVIWTLEHRINDDFRGPPSHQIGTSLWFSFSTMVFAHRERVMSNSARFLVVVWCFVVLILTQSYTASLASLLTVQQLQPTVTDVKELLKNGDYVAYLDGSFTEGLVRRLGFNPSKMRTFDSIEGLDELFSNGSIAAAFDEIPSMKLFLATYCNKYTTVDRTYKTGGFGFVFPIGSPLVADVSRAILNVTEGDTMTHIENTWFQKKTSCPDSNTLVSSNSLGINSFWGLFLIAGAAGVLSLLIFAAEFLHQQREVLRNSSDSMWSRFRQITRIYDERDLTSHAMRRSGLDSTRVRGAAAVKGSPNNNQSQSPTTISYQRDSSFVFFTEPGRPSTSDYEQSRPSTTTSDYELGMASTPDHEQGRHSTSDYEHSRPSTTSDYELGMPSTPDHEQGRHSSTDHEDISSIVSPLQR